MKKGKFRRRSGTKYLVPMSAFKRLMSSPRFVQPPGLTAAKIRKAIKILKANELT